MLIPDSGGPLTRRLRLMLGMVRDIGVYWQLLGSSAQ